MGDVVKEKMAEWRWHCILIHQHLATLLATHAGLTSGVGRLLFLPINTIDLEFDSN